MPNRDAAYTDAELLTVTASVRAALDSAIAGCDEGEAEELRDRVAELEDEARRRRVAKAH